MRYDNCPLCATAMYVGTCPHRTSADHVPAPTDSPSPSGLRPSVAPEGQDAVVFASRCATEHLGSLLNVVKP